MVFSSILFLCVFLPLFLGIYHLLSKRYKNSFTLLASLFFYTWGAPDFVGIALASIILDFYIVVIISKSKANIRFAFLWLSILLNVGLLLYFKYANFFIENINLLLSSEDGQSIEWTKLVLPIGISFYTFQKLSYSIDVYRGSKPLKRLIDYALYILLFPQLIAGPIVRFSEIKDQLVKRDSRNYGEKMEGLFRFSIGLGKKVLIANVLGLKADLVFSLGEGDLSSSVTWFGILCYTFQIYFDFSGYSDMAIGIGKMIGFKFPENFNSPYISKNISEFWRRWHITLGNWMKDYLYIPLGGNRVSSKSRLYLNLWLVFLISGFWHGAEWTFILWGAYHGLFLIADRLFLDKLLANAPSFLRMLLTFFIVVNGWVLFRATDFNQAMEFFSNLYSFEFNSIQLFLDQKTIIIFIIAVLMSFAMRIEFIQKNYNYFLHSTLLGSIGVKFFVSTILLSSAAAILIGSDFNPFIYFRF